MAVHFLFDVLAWLIALGMRYWSGKHFGLKYPPLPPQLRGRYTLVLLLGAANGAVLFGSMNLWLQFPNAIGHSVLGAILGGIVTVELFKWRHKIRRSTGVVWAMPLAIGIAVGRIGCFLAGLDDYTYGIPTDLPWAVDFGDGVLRHPVQLYESLAMLLFAACALWALMHRNAWFAAHGFYAFVLFYACQRFAWEFLKPYATLFAGLNLFQYCCLALAFYAGTMIRRNQNARA